VNAVDRSFPLIEAHFPCSPQHHAIHTIRNGMMIRTGSSAIAQWHVLGLALAFLLLGAQHTLAADTDSEHTRLAALVRQLDMLDRLAEQGASLPPRDRSRYHFDYARLREDIERVREGLRDYLTPQRAQPRDPVTLLGDYRRESEADDTP
jgi:RAQPRD family integrative conjugative element protein